MEYLTHRRTVTLDFTIEDVTSEQADEFARVLSQPGHDLYLTLSDGFEYEATVS